jgi:xylose isomerase
MTTRALIEKYLPQDLWEIATEYTIPDEFLEDAPDLIELILRSRSIDTKQEKQNWFNLLPLMNATQLEKLRAILIKEKIKLQEIEERYEGKKQEIKKKYLQKRQEMWYVKQVSVVQEQESSEKVKDNEDAEALISSV